MVGFMKRYSPAPVRTVVRSQVKQTVAKHMKVGRSGEEAAERFLRRLGYRIDGKNIRLGKDEVDILAWDPRDDVVVFVEVKTRSIPSEDFCPVINVTRKKRWSMRRAARRWVADHEYEGGYRIDVVSVSGSRVTDHIIELSWTR
ncbi:MAG: YraN family protein [Candidatus Peregrinibacteria bacterium]